ncbi:hypothetical protein [Calothrix sp. CCY 0018]|uniref:hypothetical protein n=1 Tax=Calothrix sp. CCY 0018 TaxID=3103864 RepID=UPI0039C703B3
MKAHRVEVTLTENGASNPKDLPFRAGESVEIIILENQSSQKQANPHTLKGTVIRYEQPFEPAVPPEDWEAL